MYIKLILLLIHTRFLMRDQIVATTTNTTKLKTATGTKTIAMSWFGGVSLGATLAVNGGPSTSLLMGTSGIKVKFAVLLTTLFWVEISVGSSVEDGVNDGEAFVVGKGLEDGGIVIVPKCKIGLIGILPGRPGNLPDPGFPGKVALKEI